MRSGFVCARLLLKLAHQRMILKVKVANLISAIEIAAEGLALRFSRSSNASDDENLRVRGVGRLAEGSSAAISIAEKEKR